VNNYRAMRSGQPRIAALAAAIRAAADNPTIALVRLQQQWTRHNKPVRNIVAYNAAFARVHLDQDAINAIDDLLRASRPDIAWMTDHDWHLDTGMLRRSPLPEEHGFVPEDDRSFGGADPVFLPTPADLARIEAA
jgi:hypothetical protein